MLYELLYIIPTPYTEKEVPNIQKSVDEVIEGIGAKIIYQENLGSKKLAYPIKHIRRGFYISVNFESEPSNIKKIEAKLKLMPEVLRFQIVKIKKISKVKLAKSETVSAKEKTKEKVDLKTLDKEINELLEI